MLDAGARSAMVQARVLAQYARVMAFGAANLTTDFCNLSRKHLAWKMMETNCVSRH